MASKFGGTIKGNSFEATPAKGAGSAAAGGSMMKGKGMLIMEIIGGVIILALAGLSWYFYSGNAALAAKVTALNNQSASVTAQLASLQGQLSSSTTVSAGQIAALTATNADLALNLSFYAVPLGTPTSTAAAQLPVTITGSVSGGGKAPYAITTSWGSKIFVSNSTNASTSSELKPLIGQTVQVSGTYVQGSDEIMISSVQ
jgi:hypothetical protein